MGFGCLYGRTSAHVSLALRVGVGGYFVHSDGPFIYDDFPFIVETEDLRQLWPASWLRLGGGEYAQVNSRPLLSLTSALNDRVDGLEVRGYHYGSAKPGWTAGCRFLKAVSKTI